MYKAEESALVYWTMNTVIQRTIFLMAAVCTAAISVSAQPWYIGPQLGYTIAVNTPEQVSQEGAPTRLVMGAMAVYEASPRMEIHLSTLYRLCQFVRFAAYRRGEAPYRWHQRR